MASQSHISIKELSIEFRIYGASSRSMKNQFLEKATGGRLGHGANDHITVKALEGISLEIEHGDRIGLVGHNGAGKSTFLRLLSGIYKPTRGSIDIVGNVSALIDPSSGMDVEASGIENIYLRGYVLGLNRSQIEQKIPEIADFCELGDFLNLPVKTYSAGMFSRLAFSISTSINPDIIVIDEGIGAGDAAFVEKVTARSQMFYEQSNILILASHNQGLVNSIANRVVTFSQGRIIDDVRLR